MKVTNRILNGFLIKHRIKGKYIHNCINCVNYPKFHFIGIESLDQSCENMKYVIAYSFDWSETPEGSIFWDEYDNMYYEYHRKHYNKSTK